MTAPLSSAPSTLRQRLRRGALALAASALLAGCGGGTAIEPFAPTRLMAFGDELSVLQADGRKYTVNALNATTGALDCAANPLWIQTVAQAFSLVFAGCNPASAPVSATTYATVGAKASQLSAQIDTALAAVPANDKQLATVLLGVHDILELYGRYPTTPLNDLLTEARARGRIVGEQVNRLALAGPAVIIVTAPDLGLSPFGQAQKALDASASPNRAQVLTQIGDAFNSGLRVALINDGRLIGLVSGDQLVRDLSTFPGFYGIANFSTPVCLDTAALPNCDTNTLISGGSATTYAWADGFRFSAGVHSQLGLVAQARALRNPF
jgi:outer membrane lipase/esterase